jgi:hypothetical protein
MERRTVKGTKGSVDGGKKRIPYMLLNVIAVIFELYAVLFDTMKRVELHEAVHDSIRTHEAPEHFAAEAF